MYTPQKYSQDWATSDDHFFHRNIISYSDRPFRKLDGQPDVELMNRTLVQNWNDRVRPFDRVFFLGDFAFGPKSNIMGFRKRLNGYIVFIRGNHDPSEQFLKQVGFDEVYNQLEIELEGYKLYLSHIPLWTGKDPFPEGKVRQYKKEFVPVPPEHYDWWLCGHVHNLWKRNGKIINCGVDVWDYKPVLLKELLESKDEQEVG